MMRRTAIGLTLLSLFFAVVCRTADAVMDQSQLCPLSSPCIVNKKITVTDPQGVDVRPLTLQIKSTGKLIASPAFPLTVKAGAIIVEKGGAISGDVGAAKGNTLTLVTENTGNDGSVTILGTVGASALRVSGIGGDGGTVSITAPGPCQVSGKVLANGSTSGTSGGMGGDVSLDCSTIDVNKGARIEASAAGPGGTGGNISLGANVGGLTLLKGSAVRANGSALDGGSVSLSTDASDVNDACNIGGKIVLDAKAVHGIGGAGGGLDISCGGDVVIQKGAVISLLGSEGGGTVDLFAGRDLNIAGGSTMKANASDANGGSIDMVAANNATIGGKIETRAGGASPNDGFISVTTGLDLVVAKGAKLNASAGRKNQQTGQIILAGGVTAGNPPPRLTIEQGALLKATGTGSGIGAVDVDVSDSVCTLGGKIQADGQQGNAATISFTCDSVTLNPTAVIQATSLGAFGGNLTIDTSGDFGGTPGNCVLGGKMVLRGASTSVVNPVTMLPMVVPGYGGTLGATCGLGLSVPPGSVIDVSAIGTQGVGGSVTLEANQALHVSGGISAKASGAATVGGRITVSAPGVFLEAATPGTLDASGESAGTIDVTATNVGPGTGVVEVEKPVNASGSIFGGNVAVRGCGVTVGPTGSLLADGAPNSGGINEIRAQNQLTVSGKMSAVNGQNLLFYSAGMSPTLSGIFTPAAIPNASLSPCP
jgi:hypothetical protein